MKVPSIFRRKEPNPRCNGPSLEQAQQALSQLSDEECKELVEKHGVTQKVKQ